MRTALAALGVLCFMGSCSSGMTSSKLLMLPMLFSYLFYIIVGSNIMQI